MENNWYSFQRRTVENGEGWGRCDEKEGNNEYSGSSRFYVKKWGPNLSRSEDPRSEELKIISEVGINKSKNHSFLSWGLNIYINGLGTIEYGKNLAHISSDWIDLKKSFRVKWFSIAIVLFCPIFSPKVWFT